jgi:hypothetical protein
MDFTQEIILILYLFLAFTICWIIPRFFKKLTLPSDVPPPNFGTISEYDNQESFDKTKDEFIFNLIKARFDGEIARWDSLDSKAGSMIGFVSIVTSLTVAAGSFNLQNILNNVAVLIEFFGGIILLLTSIVFSLLCFRVRQATIVPSVATLVSEYPKLSYKEALRRNSGQMSKSVTDLENLNDNKAKWISYSWTMFVIAFGYFFIVLVLFTLSNPQEPSDVEKLAKLLIDRLS